MCCILLVDAVQLYCCTAGLECAASCWQMQYSCTVVLQYCRLRMCCILYCAGRCSTAVLLYCRLRMCCIMQPIQYSCTVVLQAQNVLHCWQMQYSCTVVLQAQNVLHPAGRYSTAVLLYCRLSMCCILLVDAVQLYCCTAGLECAAAGRYSTAVLLYCRLRMCCILLVAGQTDYRDAVQLYCCTAGLECAASCWQIQYSCTVVLQAQNVLHPASRQQWTSGLVLLVLQAQNVLVDTTAVLLYCRLRMCQLVDTTVLLYCRLRMCCILVLVDTEQKNKPN